MSRRVPPLALAALMALPAASGLRPAAAATTRVVTVALAPSPEPGAGSRYPSISADGRHVVFESTSPNLVADDTNDTSDVFLHDRLNGTTERVSVDGAGAQGNDGSYYPSISRNGRYVVYDSLASNLVPNDTNGVQDVFVHDLQTGVTTLVSVDGAGAQGNDVSFSYPTISDDGRYVAFSSFATNLVAGDTNGEWDAFVHDLQTGATARVSVDSAGAQGNGESVAFSISGDGRHVAFHSAAANLVAGDTNLTYDVFIHDRQLGVTTRVSVDSAGAQANGRSGWPALSGDGRWVTYSSLASNLVPGDTNEGWDVFVHDLQSGVTTRVSVTDVGEQGNTGSYDPSISFDGRFVAFCSFASNLIAEDQNATGDTFVHDRQSGTTTRVSVNSLGEEGNGLSAYFRPAISSDGRHVAFTSRGSNLVAGDTNGGLDVFVRDRQAGTTERTPDGGQPPPPGAVLLADGVSSTGSRSLNANGRYVAFESEATTLVDGDTNEVPDVFVRDLQTRTTARVSVASSGEEGDAGATSPAISGDGRYVAFDSAASNLVTGDTNGVGDVFVHDRQAGSTTRVSVDSTGAEGAADSRRPSISRDGRFVSFESSAANLITGDTNGEDDIFVHDRQTGATTRISIDSAGSQATSGGHEPSISGDGRCVAFVSDSADLVPGDTNSASDIFVHDRVSGTTHRVSVDSAGIEGIAGSSSPAIAGDCRHVAFASRATNLAPGSAGGLSQIYVHDRASGATTRLSISHTGLAGNRNSLHPSISDDGRYVAFESSAALVEGDTNLSPDVFVRDRETGTTRRVSVDDSGTQGNASSDGPPAISGNGTLVAFRSEASNLVPGGDFNGLADLFVRDTALLVDGFESGTPSLWDSITP